MSNLQYAKNFTELVVYQKAAAVAQTVYENSKAFPKEERYSLTDQIRRSCLDQLVHRLLRLGERDGIRSIL